MGSYAESLTASLLALFCGRGELAFVLTAYIDDGGKYPDTISLTVGGCIAKDTDWLKLTTEWQRVLCAYSVRAYHAVDCHQGQLAFTGWSRPRRDAIVYDLITVLEENAVGFIGSFLRTADYDALSLEDRSLLGHPYGLCFEHCLERVDRVEQFRGSGPIAIVFEEAKKLTQHAMTHYDAMKLKPQWEHRLISCSKAGKHDFVPLQCADLIAYWANKVQCESDNERESFTLYTRPEFTRLSNTERMKLVKFDPPGLKKRLQELREKVGASGEAEV